MMFTVIYKQAMYHGCCLEFDLNFWVWVSEFYIVLIDERHRKLRYNLKVAIKSRDRYQLDYNITEFKKEKLEDTDMDLVKAEKILKELLVRDG